MTSWPRAARYRIRPPGPLSTYDPKGLVDQSAPTRTVMSRGQTYVEIDDGRSSRLVPISSNGRDPIEDARAANRNAALLANPFGSAAYSIAALLGAPEEARDKSLFIAASVGNALSAGAPYAARGRFVTPVPPAPATSAPIRQPMQTYGQLTAQRQATRADAWVTANVLGTGTKSDRRIKPPGWSGNGRVHNEARAHLLARLLGGSGVDPQNLITLTHNPTNLVIMSRLESAVAQAARRGEVIRYSATPMYVSGRAAPTHIVITATGSRGFETSAVIANPAAGVK